MNKDFRTLFDNWPDTLARARTDEALAEQLDSLDALEPAQALLALGAQEEDDPAIDADEAAYVGRAVSDLLSMAPPQEKHFLPPLGPLELDSGIEALSNVFRRYTTNQRAVTWLTSGNVEHETGVLEASELALEVARYVDLWVGEAEPPLPAPEATAFVLWARRAVQRVPALFRHVEVQQTTDGGVVLVGLPLERWSRVREERWMGIVWRERRPAPALRQTPNASREASTKARPGAVAVPQTPKVSLLESREIQAVSKTPDPRTAVVVRKMPKVSPQEWDMPMVAALIPSTPKKDGGGSFE